MTVTAVRMRSLNSILPNWLFVIGRKPWFSRQCTESSVQRPREEQMLISTRKKWVLWSDDERETRQRRRRRAARSVRTSESLCHLPSSSRHRAKRKHPRSLVNHARSREPGNLLLTATLPRIKTVRHALPWAISHHQRQPADHAQGPRHKDLKVELGPLLIVVSLLIAR